MEELILKAPAKLNLHLQVLKKREDGFHDLSSLFTLINLYDSLIFKEQNKSLLDLVTVKKMVLKFILKDMKIILIVLN